MVANDASESLLTLSLQQHLDRWFKVLCQRPERFLAPVVKEGVTAYQLCPTYQGLVMQQLVLTAVNETLLTLPHTTVPVIKLGRTTYSQPKRNQPWSRRLRQSYHLSLDGVTHCRWVATPFWEYIHLEDDHFPTLTPDHLLTLFSQHHRRFVEDVTLLVKVIVDHAQGDA